MRETIYDVKWEELLPTSMTQDKRILAMAKAISEQKRKIADEMWRARVWSEIDRMPERILDLLAYDMKIDWWDESYSVEEKRNTMKNAWYVHQRMGTAAAVEAAISAIYPDTTVSEWWEYGGSPYHFKLLIDATYENIDQERHEGVLKRVDYYKNVRSHMDGVEYTARPDSRCQVFAGVAAAGIGMQINAEVKVYGMG